MVLRWLCAPHAALASTGDSVESCLEKEHSETYVYWEYVVEGKLSYTNNSCMSHE